jgi:hypothetical protein
MHPPMDITYHGVLRSDLIEECIRQEWESLSDIGAAVTSSSIIVSEPGPKHFSGDPCRLRIFLSVEGIADITVNHDPGAGKRHDAQRLAVRDAFRIVRRRLEGSMLRSELRA